MVAMSDTETTTKPSKPTTKKSAAKKSSGMSAEHKRALAEGRRQAKAVSDYLEALKVASAPRKRGRQRTPESIQQRLDTIEQELANDPTPLQEVQLIQERLDLQEDLKQKQEQEEVDPDEYLPAFIESAAAYSERKGITYDAWRQLGVAPKILKEAGVPR